MREQEVVTAFYNMIDEEERLQSRHGQVEFQTTMKYIHDYLKPGMRVLEIGAGTGQDGISGPLPMKALKWTR